MCHALLLFMGNAITGGGGHAGSRKTTESARSGVSDLKMTAITATSAMVSELTRDVERLKAAMDEKDRTIEQLGRAVEDIRVSLISYDRAPTYRAYDRDANPPPPLPSPPPLAVVVTDSTTIVHCGLYSTPKP